MNTNLDQEIETICAGLMQLPGWCTPAKARHLAAIVFEEQPTTVVEIGVFGGRSMIPMALALQRLNKGGMIYGIDAWSTSAALAGMDEHDADDKAHIDYWKSLDLSAVMQAAAHYIEERKLWSHAALIQGRSENLATLWPLAVPFTGARTIDLLHIDGNHTPECSCRDVKLWLPRVRPGGAVFMDDTNWPSTQRAIALIEKDCTLVSVHPGAGTEYRLFRKNEIAA